MEKRQTVAILLSFLLAVIISCGQPEMNILEKPEMINMPNSQVTIKVTKIVSTQNKQKMIKRLYGPGLKKAEFVKIHPEPDYVFLVMYLEFINKTNEPNKIDFKSLEFTSLSGSTIHMARYFERYGGYMTGTSYIEIPPNDKIIHKFLGAALLRSEKGMKIQYGDHPPLLLMF